jgi:Ca2+-binding RTX toxin-like protein
MDDLTSGGGGNDVIQAKGGNDEIYGHRGKDKIKGQAGDDALYGGKGKDTLNGNRGDDYLVGGIGNDVLTGGKGNDQFVFRNVNESGDIIRDFVAGDDLINLSDIFRASTASSNLMSTEPLTNMLQLVDDGMGNTEVWVDPDGSGLNAGFEMLVKLQGVSVLSVDANSFVI